MKTMAVVALTAILVTAAILPSISLADAATATVEDGKVKLSPKSYGEKTVEKMNGKSSIDKIHKTGVSKQQIKDKIKLAENERAIQFMKIYYNLRV